MREMVVRDAEVAAQRQTAARWFVNPFSHLPVVRWCENLFLFEARAAPRLCVFARNVLCILNSGF